MTLRGREAAKVAAVWAAHSQRFRSFPESGERSRALCDVLAIANLAEVMAVSGHRSRWVALMGWFSKLLVIGVVGYVGYYTYDLNRGGYFSLPDIPDGAYPISFTSGFRGVVYDMDVTEDRYTDLPKLFRRLTMANPDRRFLGFPYEVPRWFEKTWSTCRAGTKEERDYILSSLPEDMKRDLVGARLDAICLIEIEGESPILRGLIYSVPA